MLVILSLPFIIIPFIYPLFKMCHVHRKIATINQLIKIDSSSSKFQIDIFKGKWDYTYILDYNF